MRRISTFICPQKIGEVKEALKKVGYSGNTVSYTPSNGSSKLKSRFVTWQGSEYVALPIEKIKMELTVADKDVDSVRMTIEKAHTNGSNGASNDRPEYALIPKNKKMEKINDNGSIQYANIVGRTEPLEVVQR